MKKSVLIAGVVFLALSLADVLTLAFGVRLIHLCIKPLLIPSLAAAALCALLPEYRGRRTVLLATGLALHTAGDILLMLDGYGFIWFALGHGAFLLGHICYIWLMLDGMGALRNWKEILCVLFPLLVSIPAGSLFHAEGALHYALLAYAYTLLTLVACGVLWKLRGRRMGWRIVLGGILFIVSDTLLALCVFNGVDFPLRNAVVMGSYLAAEWLLVSGMVRDLSVA